MADELDKAVMQPEPLTSDSKDSVVILRRYSMHQVSNNCTFTSCVLEKQQKKMKSAAEIAK